MNKLSDKELIEKLKHHAICHLKPYNLGDMGETCTLIDEICNRLEHRNLPVVRSGSDDAVDYLKKLTMYVNGVTAWHRHGNKIPTQHLDKLSNYQIECEKFLERAANK